MRQPYLPVGDCWPQLAQTVQTWAQCQAGIQAPDMSSLSCIVPGFSHANLLRQALQARIHTALVPPRIYTLDSLAQEWGSDDGLSELGETARLLTVYAVLREQAWAQKMAGASVAAKVFWPMARQLLQLCDELSVWFGDTSQLPWCHETDLQAWLQQQFGARAELLSFEAHLLLKVWHALRDPRSPPALMQQRLSRVPQCTSLWGCRALCWIIDQPWEELPAWQQQWAQSCADILPFQVWYPDWDGVRNTAVAAQSWQVVECADLEQEALTAARCLLAYGAAAQHHRKSFAVIAQDVVVARRLLALLGRAQIPVQDETGWKLSTSAAAAVLMRWLEASVDDAPWNAVLEVIKSPFVSLAPESVQTELAHLADVAWRATQSRGSWSVLYDSLEQALSGSRAQVAIVNAFTLLADQSRRLQGSASLGKKIQGLLQGMQVLGLSARFETDAAGQKILQRLQTTLHAVSESDEVELTLEEFQAWLSQQFETGTFHQHSTKKAQNGAVSVALVSLQGARLRPWDAVVWVGAGAEVMQPAMPETLFFGTRVRHELGLPTRAQAQAQMERHLLELLSLNVPTTLTWRAWQGDEPLALAPLLAQLQLLALNGKRQPFIVPYSPGLQTCAVRTPQVPAHVPVDSMLLPRRLSALAWEDLIACPYRYWAQNVWRLGPRDEIQDTTSQRDYGNTVHHILYQTHLRFEQQPDQDFGALLQAVAEEIFTGLAQRYPDAFAWQERFEAWKIDYLPWWEQQRKQGWRWCGGELRREYALPLAQGQSLTLYGRIDRLDQHEQEQRLRVLDYKAKSQKQLKKMQLQIGEQTQLLFYGLLCLTEAEQARLGLNAAYLPVDELETSLTLYEALEDDSLFMQALQAEQRRLQSVWLGLNHGTVLWAQGSAEACRYCAMRGLCRRDEREAPGQTAEPIV